LLVHGVEPRRSHSLQRREAAGMVGVRVTVEEYLHVGHLEAQLQDVALYLGRGLGESPVEQYEATGGMDEVGRDVRRADVVDVAYDPEGRDRLILCGLLRSQGCLHRNCRQTEQSQQSHPVQIVSRHRSSATLTCHITQGSTLADSSLGTCKSSACGPFPGRGSGSGDGDPASP